MDKQLRRIESPDRGCELQGNRSCHERLAAIQSVQIELHRYARIFHDHLLKRAVHILGIRTALLLGSCNIAARFKPGEEQEQREYKTGNDCF